MAGHVARAGTERARRGTSAATAQRRSWWRPSPLRRLFGVPASFVVDGVRYRELTREPLTKALAPRGRGYKDYLVRFPDGRETTIRCTRSRQFADLTGPRLIPQYQLAEPWIRPGQRLVALRTGTGYAAAWLAQRVGPSGAVVALEPDEAAVHYAEARYRGGPVAFEPGGIAELTGETDGAFDAAFAVEALHVEDDPVRVLSELFRLVQADGWMLVTAPTPARRRQPALSAPSVRQLDADGLIRLVRQAAAARFGPEGLDAPRPDAEPAIELLEAPAGLTAALIRPPQPTRSGR